jgi:hypothetical protein
VDVPPELIDWGAKEMGEPLGCPEALRPTVCVVPWVMAVVMGMSTDVPATSVADGGTPMLKSLGWALTVSVKLWLDGVPAPVAVMVIGYELLEPVAGVPPRVAVPSPLSLKVTPVGSAPLSANVGVGVPAVVTVKVPGAPWVKVVVLAEVMVGAVLIVTE